MRSRNHAAFLVTLLAFSPLPALSCSIARWPPDYPLDPEQYTFYGEVTGYVPYREPICYLGRDCETSYGFELTVVVSLQPTGMAGKTAHLFSFGMNSLCQRRAYTRDAIERVPIGAKLKVSAPLLEDAAPAEDSSAVLELEHFLLADSILVRLPEEADLEAEAAAERDYGLTRLQPGNDKFEVRKDLIRLERAASEEARAAILERLAYYRGDRTIAGGTREESFDVLLDAYTEELGGGARDNFRESEMLSGGITLDDDRAVDDLLDFAGEGRALSQFLLAISYLDDEQYEKAVVWFDIAARAGYPLAEAFVGHAYREMVDDIGRYYDELERGRATITGILNPAVAEAYDRAAETARELVGSRDPMGELMIAELYAAGVENLLDDEERLHAIACRGASLRPIWRDRKHNTLMDFGAYELGESVEERGGSCRGTEP